MQKLVIVESPAKAKTIKKYLGPGFEVVASMGHIRDLPRSLLGVDLEHDFKPRYVDIPGKTALIRQLRALAAGSSEVLLATDPDREGEAISWHLAQLLGLDIEQTHRVTFNEITKTGVTQGIQNPRTLDMDLVDAQQARRILDRIVGYKLSPYLWQTVRKGLSAGRVQSATVNLIVQREEEISVFVSEEYWSIEALLSKTEKEKPFTAHFYGTKREKMKLANAEQTQAVFEKVSKAVFTVDDVKNGVKQLSPAPPFITSTLQQEASRKLTFAARRTMKAAQELYEGVDVEGVGMTGLITYMRTDSLRISDEARKEGCDYIAAHYGKQYLPEKPRVFKSRGNAQDGHEAIRPTSAALTPGKVRGSLTSDQYRLYKLIWERFIASLMANCVHSTCQMDIAAGEYVFKASGYRVTFDGFTALYTEGSDEKEETDGALPELKVGDKLLLRDIGQQQHFTKPPARYTEATLIKALEENGIGRPSTYAPTISIILNRDYVERDGKALRPTALGEVTTRLMRERFPEVVGVEFTASMEEKLDEVENGKSGWITTLHGFYDGFAKTLEDAQKNFSGERVAVPAVESDVKCELCGRTMVIKSGRYGKFLACPGYPECKNTKKIVKPTGGICPKCGGAIVGKKSKTNRVFYGCENYPKCDFVTWNEPVSEVCPHCGKTLFKKKGGKDAKVCLTEDCAYNKQ